MSRYFLGSTLGIVLALFSLGTVRAQGETLDEGVFWDRLAQTSTLLDQALAQPVSARSTAPILRLWTGVQHVRLLAPSNGESVLDVDMRWITIPVTAGDTASLQAVKRQVNNLLAYHKRGGGTLSSASLAALDQILNDPRFQYSEPTPTPAPTPVPQNANNGNGLSISAIPAGLAQAMLAVLGVIVVLGVVVYFLRLARAQPAAVDLSAASPDDPVTAQNALSLASNRAASRDYRSAIRYLYLSSLLRLDERGVIHYNATLTNREHLAQVTDKPQISELLRQIVTTFEDAWYGYIPADAAAYQLYEQRIQRLWQIIA